MLFQLRERDGGTSASSSGTFIAANGTPKSLQKTDFGIKVLEEWRSPHTQGLYPSSWEIRLGAPECALQVRPWLADQEIHFPSVTYWEGAVHFEGMCNGVLTLWKWICGAHRLCRQFASAVRRLGKETLPA